MTPADAPRDATAGPGSPGPVGDGGVPEAGGVDLQPDVERIHRAIRREPHDPIEGHERAPWFFTAAVALALFWGGWYLGRYGGEFGPQTHIAFAARQTGIAAAAAEQSAVAISDPIAAGRTVFENNCQSCHQATGQGVPGVFPPLVGAEWVTGPAATTVRILLHGLQGPVEVAGTTYNGAMPAWQDVLKDEEIAAVATYVRQLESNDAPAVPAAEVAALRAAHSTRTTPWTAAELQSAPPAPTADSAAPAAPAAPAVTPGTPGGPP